MSEFEFYYTELFNAPSDKQNDNVVRHFVSFVTPLTEEECSAISGSFTQQEIELAIDQLPISKTPGPDGISGEFYKAFKFLLSPVLLKIFKLAFDLDTLPQSFTRSHTVFIPKYTDKEKLRSVEG